MSADIAFARPRGESGEPGTSYAQKIIQNAKILRSGSKSEPAIYKIRLTQAVVSKGTYCAYFFGEQSEMYDHHKVIMLVGETGTGKSTLVNTIINYILGVKYEDEFRFKIVDEEEDRQRSQAHSQTQVISSYTIRRNKYHNIPYTLTIIDTPGFGDTRGIERDKALVDQIQGFFCDTEHHQVDHIDGICIIVKASDSRLTPTQRYVFDSVLALFGKDVKQNMLLFVTFCGSDPQNVVDAIKEAEIPCNDTFFKFNNSALYWKGSKSIPIGSLNENDAGLLSTIQWQMGDRNLKKFFKNLDQLSPKSLSLTKDVLNERKCLENAAENLEPQLQLGNSKLDKLQKEKDMLKQYKQEIKANKSFQYEADVAKCRQIKTPQGANNCKSCHFTCHYPCTRKTENVRKCYAIHRSRCTVCPKKCTAEYHVIQNFKIEYFMVKETQTYADIEQRFKKATGKKETVEQVIQELEAELKLNEKAVQDLLRELHRCVVRLREIALKPHPIGIDKYLDLLIAREKEEARPGWQMKVQRYENWKAQGFLLSSVSDGLWGEMWRAWRL